MLPVRCLLRVGSGAGSSQQRMRQCELVLRATHAYLARTPCVLALAQIDDLTDEADPVNVPATPDKHPHRRRRLSNTLEQLAERPRFVDIAAIFRKKRGGRRAVEEQQA